jgi:hypothetical protein
VINEDGCGHACHRVELRTDRGCPIADRLIETVEQGVDANEVIFDLLEAFLAEDEEAETARYRRDMQLIVD